MTAIPSTLSYQTAAPPLLRQPRLATIGFLFLGIPFAVQTTITLLHSSIPSGIQFPLVRFAYLGEQVMKISGFWIIIFAFFLSPVLHGFQRITMLAAAICDTALSFAYFWFVEVRGWTFFGGSMFRLTPLHFVVLSLECAAHALLFLLLLILLQRVGRRIGSRPFRIVSAIVILAHIANLLLSTATLVGDLLAKLKTLSDRPPLLHNNNQLLRLFHYNSRCTPVLLFALFIWCIFLMRPLSQKSAPLPAQ